MSVAQITDGIEFGDINALIARAHEAHRARRLSPEALRLLARMSGSQGRLVFEQRLNRAKIAPNAAESVWNELPHSV